MTGAQDWTPELERELIEESERAYELEAATTESTPLPDGVRVTRPNRARSAMFSLRLNPDELAAVQRLAAERDVPASALVRGWIVQRIAVEGSADREAASVVQRLEADVHRLRELIA